MNVKECSPQKPTENGEFIMKKSLLLMMALVMTLRLAACGGKDTPAPTQSSSGGAGNTDAASET
ncbi:hypothetical protein [Clostridium sp. BSD9I1]|uniref:hypothetical protein n=1 Tax=Clostridium sp. BSD9I1 TaxID=2003589 RepID=UPI0016456BA1|nr:hypothetical protein [Clostridium sp. BSD9I1]